MSDDNLNISMTANAPASAHAQTQKQDGMSSALVRFDIRALLIWLLLKWKLISAVFFISLLFFWGIMKYVSVYSDNAWTATAMVFHQTRSDRIPSFYKPVETETVMQFMNSGDAAAHALSRMQALHPDFRSEMLSSVDVSLNKTRRNIISVSASANNPEIAAELANIAAEEGVKEYVNRQNDSVTGMIEERRVQKSEIEKQISALQEEKKSYISESAGLPPDAELAKQREDISALISKRSELEINRRELEAKIKAVMEAMKNTPTEVVYEKIMDNTTAIGIGGKMAELERLRKRYTDENPKVRVLLDEIAELQKESDKPEDQTPTRVVYRKNDIYANLEMTLSKLTLEAESVDASMGQYDAKIAKMRAGMEAALEKSEKYASLLKKETMLYDKVSKLSQSISDMEFLISVAVPDVSMFELAKVPQSSNMQKLRVKTMAMSILTTLALVFGLGAYRVLKMRIMSAAEYRVTLGVDALGELPDESQYSEEYLKSAIQGVRRNIRSKSPSLKKAAFLKFDGDECVENDIGELLNICAINGQTSFRLKCLPLGEDGAEESPGTADSDEIAQSLISVAKFSDSGVFRHQNRYFLDVAEFDLLKFDLDKLGEHYDIVTIESACDENSQHLCSQLSRIAEYSVITSAFDKTPKITLLNNISRMKYDNPSAKIGGVLMNVRKPYFRR